jgi:acyl carrier protein
MSLSAQFRSSSTGFPQTAIEDCIAKALEDQASTQSILHGNPSTPPSAGSWEPEIDSLVVVEIICAIEEQLGVSLPQSFIPRGGYSSKEDCTADLVGQAKAAWDASVVRETVHA